MSSGKGGSQSQITGYRYRMAVHFGMCRGPVDEVTDIRVGDLTAWAGSLTTGGFFEINAADLFGGDQKEGGIQGSARLFMGEDTQTIDPVVKDNIEGGFPVPGWRGVTTLFYYGEISANNPYPKTWQFRLNRRLQGWTTDVWEPDLCSIDMSSTPLTLVSFNVQPHSGDSIKIGEFEIYFFTLVVGPSNNVQIGADEEATASNFAGMCNTNTDDLYGVQATANGLTVTLRFPSPVVVSYGFGNFVSISNQGGGIKAMNAAHILYQCSTDTIWGRGLPTSFIDTGSFKTAAQQLVNENFGLCLKWNRQGDIDTFVKQILDHIGGAVYIDRISGLVKCKLFRGDYNPDDLTAFTYSNGIIDITEDESSSSDTVFNEIIVSYFDPVAKATGSIRVHNLASLQALGTTISNSVEYVGCPTAELAARLAQRDLQINSAELRRFKIKMDRAGWFLNPGDVMKVSIPTRGFENLILRIGAIEDGPIDDETITLDCLQDVYTLPEASFVNPQPSYWVPPDRSARVIDQRLIDEMTYYDLSENMLPGDLSVLTEDTGLVKVFAEQPNGSSPDYLVLTEASGETEFEQRNIAGYDASAELATAVGYGVGTATLRRIKSAGLLGATNIPILLVSDTTQEYCRLDSFDPVTLAITFSRGCIDTIPHEFSIGDKVWFQTDMPSGDPRDYASSETVYVKLLSRTSTQVLDPTLAPIDTLNIDGRQGRPYPPGNFQIDGAAFWDTETVVGDIVFTWAHRDRITQGNFLLEHEGGSTGPETGTTYNIKVYDGADDPEVDSPLRTVTGITGDTWTYDSTMDTADGELSSYWFTIESERDSLVSWQHYKVKVARAGFGDDFGFNFGGGS